MEKEKQEQDFLDSVNFLITQNKPSRDQTLLKSSREDQIEEASVKGPPLYTLYEENDAATDLIENRLLPDLKKWQQDGKNDKLLARMKRELEELRTIKHHYQRKQNSLYSFLTKYRLIEEQVSTVLWSFDDNVLSNIYKAQGMLNSKPLPDKYVVEAQVEQAANSCLNMIFFENTILFPLLAMKLTPNDWYVVKQDEVETGYSLIDYPQVWVPTDEEINQGLAEHGDNYRLSTELVSAIDKMVSSWMRSSKEKFDEIQPLYGNKEYIVGDEANSPDLVFNNIENTVVKLEIGSLSLKEITAIFNVLPVDCTFVDKYDRVKWFSNTDRIFPRTRSVIGRPVIRCHPPKSIDKVMKILDDFHNGLSDMNDFWVNFHGRNIYLAFFAVRDNDDNYLGCLETVQDVTKFKTMEKEKTLENQDEFKD